MRRNVSIMVFALLLGGCAGSLGSLGRVLFTNATAADQEFKGFSLEPIPASAAIPLPFEGGTALPAPLEMEVAVVLPMAEEGQATHRIVLCTDELAQTCKDFKPNTPIVVTGRVDSRGIIHPTRVSKR